MSTHRMRSGNIEIQLGSLRDDSVTLEKKKDKVHINPKNDSQKC